MIRTLVAVRGQGSWGLMLRFIAMLKSGGLIQMRVVKRGRLLIVAAALATAPAYSHHSFAMFDQVKCLSVSGTVKKWQWQYPHTWLWVIAEAADHSQAIWGFEGGDPATLALHGWTAEAMAKGDKITVIFNPLIDGRNGGSMRQILLPTGKSLNAQSYDKDDKFFKACEPSK